MAEGETITPASSCPGENQCGWFAKAVGANPEEKAVEACSGCRFLSSKPNREKSDEGGETGVFSDGFIYRIERFIAKRNAGFTTCEDELTPLQYEGVVAWTEIENAYKSSFERSLFELNANVKAYLGIKN